MTFNIKKAFKTLFCLILILSILLSSIVSLAEEPYNGYDYNFYGKASAPNGYLPVESYNGTEWNAGYLRNPTDMYVDDHNCLYILDAGNNRIIKTDSDLNVLNIIETFTLNGEISPLNNPQGISVTEDGEIYICDTDNNRLVVVNQEGEIQRVYGKPETTLLTEEFVFFPKKVEVTDTGDMYVIVANTVEGAMIITEEGEFKGYYATDAVTLGAEALKVIFWRMIMTDEQIKKMMSLQPVPFDNMYLDGDFLYTATVYLREEDQIRKVNPAGVNLFKGNVFGEFYSTGAIGEYEQASFVDVNVNDSGFIYALDKNFCKVFVYNQDNELLIIFGGKGNTLGELSAPVAIESIGNKVLILDGVKNSVTVYQPTYYGEQIMLGSYKYEHGDYEEAYGHWNEVLKLNTNSEIAYRGIARAEYLAGNYKEAINNYRAAYDLDGYSESREKYRAQYLSSHFSELMIIILSIIVVLYVLAKNKKKIYAKIGYQTLEETGYAGMKKWKYPFYNLLHPSDGLSEMRYNKKESLPLAIFFMFLWYASAVVIRQYQDYIFNATDKNSINILMIFLTTVGIALIGCVANWAITTLVEGKGTFKNIFIYCSYSLIPSTIATFIATFASYYLTLNEEVFVQAVVFVGYAWTAIMLFMGMMTVHSFTTKKAILMTILTAVGMLIIIFILMLLMVLYSQVESFVTTLMYELFYRFSI